MPSLPVPILYSLSGLPVPYPPVALPEPPSPRAPSPPAFPNPWIASPSRHLPTHPHPPAGLVCRPWPQWILINISIDEQLLFYPTTPSTHLYCSIQPNLLLRLPCWPPPAGLYTSPSIPTSHALIVLLSHVVYWLKDTCTYNSG